uniref:Reverse transcriptase domain-containing protein n=1 Tax=Tanacetum cinerariifolium TaxID=118510 RepID=A0A6L2KH09_TANCI|nr:reverse transcriptase domain-containing protein [Tanacetum cinerariifolium]
MRGFQEGGPVGAVHHKGITSSMCCENDKVTRVAGKSFEVAIKKVLTEVGSSVVVEDTVKESSHQRIIPSNSNEANEASQPSTKSSPISLLEDGLSAMGTKLGNPIMLDSYTSSMRINSWGQLNYDRDLIEIRTDREIKDTMVISIPSVEGNGEVLHAVRIEYEWKPPRCDLVANDVAKVDLKVIVNPKVASCVEHVVTTSSNVNESGKSSEMVIDDSESDAEDVYDETAQFMASEGANDASLLEDEDFFG